MRSGEEKEEKEEDHCNQELADEVRRGEGGGGGGGRGSRASDIKSNNPHLAGGEQYSISD